MENLWTEQEHSIIREMTKYAFIGNQENVKTELEVFLNTTDVDEIMITSHLYDLKAKMHCLGLIAPYFKSRSVLQNSQPSALV
jgi:hypothetical protein